MTTDTTTTPAPTATDQPHPCDVCPVRDFTEDSRFGYCEGCTSRLRQCRSCEEFKPQTDWGWGYAGYIFVTFCWVCADCRVRPVSDRVADHPRFVHRLDLDERSATWLVHELEKAADRNQVHPVSDVLRRMARSLEADGNVDIDVSDFDLDARRALLAVTVRLQEGVPSPAYSAAFSLHRAWAIFVEDSSKPKPGPELAPSVAQRVAALGLEREVTSGD